MTKEEPTIGKIVVSLVSSIFALLFFLSAVWNFHTGAMLEAIYFMLGAIYFDQGK